jgi:hypothetical protein
MGIPNQHKVHKKLELYDDRITELENMVIAMLKIYGAIFSIGLLISLFVDPIRQRPFELDWLQGLACAAFSLLSLCCMFLIQVVRDSQKGW